MYEPHNTDDGSDSQGKDGEWLTLASDAFRASTDYMDSSLRKQWEKNLAMFRSKHASGSKYNSDAYKYRSKVFRPKTRSALTRQEAAAAVAFFATADVVNISPQDDNDERQRASADINGEIVSYRLEKTIPWFLTCIGAFQDAMTIGAVVSKQHWVYEERRREEYRQAIDEMTGEGRYDEETGEPVMELAAENVTVLKDQPAIDLIPIENVRFDPAADWRDVVNTSPYWIHLVPMYVGDVKARMKRIDPKTGQPEWRELDDGQLRSATKQTYDSVRQARQGPGRQDAHDSNGRVGDFEIVWVHENIIRKDNRDWVYYTLGTEHLLSEPVEIEQVYFHGKRPFVMGYAIIETHRVPPAGLPEIWEGLQTEANDIANQRLDNVKLTLNTRYFATRTGNVDYRALTRSVPGGVVLMDDINANVRADRPGDVTGSSYQEQDRLGVDFDELAGTFSAGSIQSNRALNETVGGMNLLSADANAVTDYRLRVFSETWVEPVLRQLVMLEQHYETDAVVLTIAGKRADLYQKYGIDRVTDDILQGELSAKVNVGFGATNPQQKVDKLIYALNSMAAASNVPGVNAQEVKAEIFGALGYKDGSRFFNDEEDPRIAQLMQQIQELQAALEGKQMDNETKLRIADMQTAGRLEETKIKESARLQVAEIQARVRAIDAELASAAKDAETRIDVERLKNERVALVHQMRVAAKQINDRRENARSAVITNDRYSLIPGVRG